MSCARPAASKQVTVSSLVGAGKMALEGLSRSIRFAVRIDVQHDPRDLAPEGTFRIRIEHAHVSEGMLFVMDGERGIGGRQIGNIRIEGGMGVLEILALYDAASNAA